MADPAGSGRSWTRRAVYCSVSGRSGTFTSGVPCGCPPVITTSSVVDWPTWSFAADRFSDTLAPSATWISAHHDNSITVTRRTEVTLAGSPGAGARCTHHVDPHLPFFDAVDHPGCLGGGDVAAHLLRALLAGLAGCTVLFAFLAVFAVFAVLVELIGVHALAVLVAGTVIRPACAVLRRCGPVRVRVCAAAAEEELQGPDGIPGTGDETDPFDADSDDDGLLDGTEVIDLGTDPNNSDVPRWLTGSHHRTIR